MSGSVRPPDGYVVVDKPVGMTSHDVVARARRLLGERRIGHGGTLDPDATGVLVLGVGRATRLLRFVSELPKTYVGEIVLGTATTTLDAAGDLVGTWDMSSTSLEAAREAAAALTGHIEQIPPMVSAVQVGGRRLHELAREGIEVERAARPVEVYSFELEETATPGVLRAQVSCSSGTYVRSLAADLGAALGGGAHLRALRRLAVGPFTLEEALALEALSPEQVLAPAGLVGHLHPITVDPDLVDQVAHGRVLEPRQLGAVGEGPWALLDDAGRLLAVYERRGDERAKPLVVLAEPSPSAPSTDRPQRTVDLTPDASIPGASIPGASIPGGSIPDSPIPDSPIPDSSAQISSVTNGAPGSAATTEAVGADGPARWSVVAAGSFDGVHLGHRALLSEAGRLAKEVRRPLVALTFDRHPAAVVRPEGAPPLLTGLERRVALLHEAGADEVVVLAFDAAQAAIPPEQFVEETLAGSLGAVAVVTGSNFRFGQGGRGDAALLAKLGERLGFRALAVPLLAGDDGSTVSSSLIRSLIAKGRLGEAAELLGRPHELSGRPAENHPSEVILDVGLALPPAGSYRALARPDGTARPQSPNGQADSGPADSDPAARAAVGGAIAGPGSGPDAADEVTVELLSGDDGDPARLRLSGADALRLGGGRWRFALVGSALGAEEGR
ncbi:MAG: truB [Acidimicrobiaceae bacterium]|nr:truB [Acidimicrobiaceae bacterium]